MSALEMIKKFEKIFLGKPIINMTTHFDYTIAKINNWGVFSLKNKQSLNNFLGQILLGKKNKTTTTTLKKQP